MDIHKDFTEWAVARGVKISGIAVHRFPGRGVGIIAERSFKAGDTLLKIPIRALRTVETVPKAISVPVGKITVHGLMAAHLALDSAPLHAPWRAVLPSKKDVEESMPIMWHTSLQSLLPPAALHLLENQKKKLSRDWASVSSAFPSLPYSEYLYNWLIIGTRTFFFTSPRLKSKKPLNRDDCLALTPFGDYFNHADMGCEVTFGPGGYETTANRAIKKGEEIYISYGNHSNDFLLAEYGFILDKNKWDEISLDEYLLPLFSKQRKEELENAGFLGKYALDGDTFCYRTQIALRLLFMPLNRWQRLVAGAEDGEKYNVLVDSLLLETLEPHLKTIDEKLKRIDVLDCGLASQRETLRRRWEQMQLLLTSALIRIQN